MNSQVNVTLKCDSVEKTLDMFCFLIGLSCSIKNERLLMLQTSIISREPNAVIVRMSRRRWNHLQKLEESYKVAVAIRKGMKQVEKAPSMSIGEAIESLRSL